MRKPELKRVVKKENPRGHVWEATDTQGYSMECSACGEYVGLMYEPPAPGETARTKENDRIIGEDCPWHKTNSKKYAEIKAEGYRAVMGEADFVKYHSLLEARLYEEAEDFRIRFFGKLFENQPAVDGYMAGCKKEAGKKISELGQHCGECSVIDYCGNPFGYCLCHDERFSNMDEKEYAEIAQGCRLETYEGCKGCSTEDDCSTCDLDDERKDFECKLNAEQVSIIMRNTQSDNQWLGCTKFHDD